MTAFSLLVKINGCRMRHDFGDQDHGSLAEFAISEESCRVVTRITVKQVIGKENVEGGGVLYRIRRQSIAAPFCC